ncbi:MAG: carboxypeptidase regulatory-like domain-containing protein [Pyrinomonadaceae bacterium]
MKTTLLPVHVLIIFLLAAAVFGQTATTARISGAVTDPTGAAISGATIKLIDKGKNVEKTVLTNSEGLFAFPGIEPGVYDLSVSAPGFRAVVFSDIKADVSTAKTLDVSLNVGGIAEQVTVEASSPIQLQNDDSSIGNVIEQDRINRLPSTTRQAVFLLQLQPGIAPVGEVTGARSDQNTYYVDGIDVTDNVIAAPYFTVIPAPNESVAEFRVTVANPNATFGRSAGAQVSLVTKHGTNEFHGSVYEYLQNDNLNANSWTNNRLGLARPTLINNTFGVSFGGPLLKEKLFFFFNYERGRQRSTTEVTRIVPTQSFRNGQLRFRDASGGVFTVNPLTFDPRNLGSNPQILASLRLMPLPNNFAFGDGLNTGGFSANLPLNQDYDFGVTRLDYQINNNWSLEAKGAVNRAISLGVGQVNLIEQKSFNKVPFRPRNLTFALIGSVRPNLVNEIRYGYVYESLAIQSIPPTTVGGFNLPVNLAPGPLDSNPNFALLDEPIDVDTARAAQSVLFSGSTQLIYNATWTKGKHTFQFGGNLRRISTVHVRDDKLIGSLTTPVAAIGAAGNVMINPAQRPPACGPGVLVNCLQPGDVSRYDQFYASLLGIVDSVSYLAVRDASLQPLPIGTGLASDSVLRHWEFYFSDVWRIKPSITFSYGLMYQWHTPPKDKQGRQTLLTYRTTGTPIDPRDYLRQKAAAAEAGNIFNPDIAYVPIKEARQDGVFQIYRKDFSPRVSLAWQPSFKRGWLGQVFGDQRSVIRGGYAIVYDRINTFTSVLLPMFGVGFGQTLTLRGPLNAGGQPFRAGVDGPIPLPLNFAATSPIVPARPFGETLSFTLDPKLADPRNHVINFTVQRKLAGKMRIEVAYVGRFARNLLQNVNLNSAPYFFKDRNSGQRFSEAFDAVARQLRGGVAPSAVTPQPWFENQLILLPGATRFLAQAFTSDFIAGNLNNLWNLGIDFFTPTPYNNQQSLDLFVRTSEGKSNYNAMLVSLHQQNFHGLTFDFNYTLSRSRDQVGQTQGFLGSFTQYSSSFDPNLDYGPSDFDARHLVNTNFVYYLPFGRSQSGADRWKDKLIAGWRVAGIFQAQSGFPLTVTQGFQVFGAGSLFGTGTGAIPINRLNVGNSVNSGVTGSGGIGTGSNPANGGSGLNMFANPEQVFNSFRRVEISTDRSGRGVLRGFPRWQLDLSLGKTTKIGERFGLDLAFDFFNIFNHVNFADPVLDLNNKVNFGVVTSQVTPGIANSFYKPRAIQFGARIEF